jgi:uncharacterized protein HemY
MFGAVVAAAAVHVAVAVAHQAAQVLGDVKQSTVHNSV